MKCFEGDKLCSELELKNSKIKINNSEKDDKEKELEELWKLINYEVYKNITEIGNNIIDSLQGEYSIRYSILENKLGENIYNGEVTISYDLLLLLNAIEITIISKLTNEVGIKHWVGVKYKIIPNPEPEPVPEQENYEENLISKLLEKPKEYILYNRFLKVFRSYTCCWVL